MDFLIKRKELGVNVVLAPTATRKPEIRVNSQIFVEIGAQIYLFMVCLLRMGFKIGILCNAVFVNAVAYNSYLITKIKEKIIDIVFFMKFKNANTSTVLCKFYKSFFNLINFYVIHDVKVY